MKFHGTLVPPNAISEVPWNSMECSMEFHGTKWYVIWRHQSSMEFNGIFYGIPWNTCVICNGALLIPWNPMELGDFLFGHSRVPRNSMVYPIEVQDNMVLIKMEFHGTEWYCIWRHQNSMEFHGIRWKLGDSPFGGPIVPWNFVSLHLPWNFRSFMEFHGTSHLSMGIPWNSMEFHGIWLHSQIPWNFENSIEFHGTSQLVIVIPWNSMESGYVAKFHGTFKIPWNSMELLF